METVCGITIVDNKRTPEETVRILNQSLKTVANCCKKFSKVLSVMSEMLSKCGENAKAASENFSNKEF